MIPTPTLPIQEIQRRLRALIGGARGELAPGVLCLSDIGRYIGRPYWQVRALAYGERRMTAEDQVALSGLFARFVDPAQENVARGFRIEHTADGPRLKR